MEQDWELIAQSVALETLGEPSKKSSKEWRWGNKGSFVLDLENGTFFDFEKEEGGGVTWFFQKYNIDKDQYLEKQVNIPPKTKYQKTFSDQEMKTLLDQSICYVRYSENFCVMRFNYDHSIKQKYAPFTKENGKWFLKRPQGTLPIYLTDKKTEYVILTEGEKAMLAAREFSSCDVCCHHGGVGNWRNCDWTLLKDRNVLIWPDNDEAGKKFAFELQEHLNKIASNVLVVKPHKDLEEKEDLYEVIEKNIFKDHNELLDYCLKNTFKKKVSFELVPVSKIIQNIQKPNWLIKDVCELDSVIAMFGSPKAGKSFVAVDIAAHISKGLNWNDLETKQHTVVYLAGEGQRGIARRISAWSYINNTDLIDAPLLISNRGARLLDQNDHDNLKDSLYEAEDNFGQIGMIIVDTLARNFGAGNENSTEDMNAFVERVDDLKNTFNSCICLVHHTGHGASNRARGSSVLPAAVDWEYKITREDINGEMFVDLEQTLVKDGNNINPINFKFDVVSLPFDDSTSGALTRISSEQKPRKKELNDNDHKIYDLIDNMQSSSDDPAAFSVKHNQIIEGTGLTKNIVNKSLKKLLESNKLQKNEYGYQTFKYDSKLF